MESQAGSHGNGRCITADMEQGSIESYRFYLSRRTLFQMLSDRGYNVPHSELIRSLSDFRAFFGQNPDPSRLRICLPLISSPSKKLCHSQFQYHHLRRGLLINDCGGLECFPERGLSIPNLEYLKIERCENLKSLTHQMRNLKSLRSLTISECPGLESFPEEGLAPNLTLLEIDNCKNLKTPISEWGFDTLTTLSNLIIKKMFPDMVSFSVKESRLPFSLTRLYIDGMESLASLALCNLISLQFLDISNCPNLRSLGPLPATLAELFIYRCPTIEERYLKEGGECWSNVAQIPCISKDIQRLDIVDMMLYGIIDDSPFLDFN